MPKTYNQVRDEFLTWKKQYGDDPRVAQAELADFAKLADESAQSPGERSSAYNDNMLKQVDALIGRGMAATGAPAASKAVFGGAAGLADSMLGTNTRPTVEAVAEELPRGILESLATIPVAATGAGAPAAAAVWLNRANKIRNFLKPVGYASTGLAGYGATDSPLGAAISMGSMKLGNKLLLPAANKGVDVGMKVEKPVQEWLAKGIPDIVPKTAEDLATKTPHMSPMNELARTLPVAANVATQAGVATGLQEATRQGMMSVGPNAVPWDDPSRNPLTPENVAAQAVGAVGFVPQGVTALAKRPAFKSKQAQQWVEWHETRKRVMEEAGVLSLTQDDIKASLNGANPQEVARGTMINAFVDYYQHAVAVGDPMAPKYKAKLMEWFSGDGWEKADVDQVLKGPTGEAVPTDPETTRMNVTALANKVAQSASLPTTTVPEFAKFKLELNTLIDQVNELTAQGSGETKFVKGKYVPPSEKDKGKTWHPSPTSAEAVEQLQKQKLLPEITDEWFQTQMGEELGKGMDPNTAFEIVKQKAANTVLDAVPAALEARGKLPPDATGEGWKQPGEKKSTVEKQKDVQRLDERFVDALNEAPEGLRDAIIKRSLTFLNESPRVAEKGNLAGRAVGRYSSWRLAVIKAMETYNPEDGTVVLYRPQKDASGKVVSKYVRAPFSDLVSLDEIGNYKFNPRWSPVKTSEGGKMAGNRKGKTYVESNLEGMSRPEDFVTDTIADEADFDRALVEEGFDRGTLRDVVGEGSLEKPTSVPEGVMEIGVDEPFVKVPEGDAALKWEQKAATLKKNLGRLTDAELNQLTDPFFVRKTPEGKPYADAYAKARRPMMRAAVEAALEQFAGVKNQELGEGGKKFLAMYEAGKTPKAMTERQRLLIALKDFFKQQTPVEGAPEGLKNHEARFGQIAQALLDEKRLANVEGLRTRASVGTPVEGTAKGVIGDVFTEGTVADDFPTRVRQMLTPRIYRALGESGLSGSYRALVTEMAVALALQTKGIKTRFYNLELPGAAATSGLAKAEGGLGKVGIVLKNVMDEADVDALLGTLAHEVHHIQQMAMEGLLLQKDAFSQYQAKAMRHMEDLATMLTSEERDGYLSILQETFQPPNRRTIPVTAETKRLYGSETPKEFTAQVASILARSLLLPTKKGAMSPFEVLSWMPPEITEYSRGVFRAIEDVFDGVQKAIADPEVRKMVGGEALTPEGQKSKTFQADVVATILASAREGSRLRDSEVNAKAMMQQTLVLSPGAGEHPPLGTFDDAVWKVSEDTIRQAYKGSGLEPPIRMSTTVREGVDMAKEVLYKAVKDPTTRPGLWARWFYPFTNLMVSMERAGVPLARPLGLLSTGLAGGIKRTQSLFMSPWTVKNPDGTVRLDHENALIDKLGREKVGPWRDAVNEVSRWQQKKDAAVTMFVKDETTGQITVNQKPGVQEKWDKIRSHLSPEDQTVVMNASVALDEQGQLMAARTVATLQKSMEFNVAAVLMKAYRMPYDKAQQLASTLVPAYLQMASPNPQDKVAAAQVVGQYVSGGPIREMIDGLMIGDGGLVPSFLQTKDRLLGRVGYRTETLPGDFIIRFQPPDAKANEFKYLSANTESQANLLAKRLQEEGNTIVGEIAKKSEIRDYADFDDPDAVLRSFIEVENSKWRQLVDQMRKTHGDEVADDLLSYSPGVESERFLATKGMGKTLVERQSKVDRTRFDYIDAAIAHAQRLATSLEYRLARQEKNLILADPRAKLYPSLKPLVNNHFDELMSPSTRFGQEMRTFAGAYFMGGSLASAIINATQSLTTLLPVLVQGMGTTGGVVGAYNLLGKNIARTVKISLDDKWQGVARQAGLKDSKYWTLDEAQAALYKRNVEEGGVDHGIILDDVFSGTDTRALLTSKFGRGDYGPVTKGELARNGLYLAAQLSLRPFGWMEKQNNKIALLAGIEQGYDKGLRGEALYDYARTVKSLATFGGGKANAPGLVGRLSNQHTRSLVGMANVLQQYGYGVVALYAQQVKDALGNSPGLSPLERRQAAKAFLTMFSTQVALGGALGLPFAGAALTLIEQLTGTPANQLVREGLAGLSEDETVGPVFAETALNGLGNQMFGFDVSSRVGVSSLAGTSAYRGFNIADMVGPTGSIVRNMADALNYFGQGRPEKAAHALVPNSLRTMTELYNTKKQFGDLGVRDASGNLLHQLSPNEAAMYAIGFRPTEVSRGRQMQRLMTTANELGTRTQGNEFDRAARALLQGDTSVAQEKVREYTMHDPTINPQEMYRSIVDRAVDATFQKDPQAVGPRVAERERTAIAKTFSPEVRQRQSEVDREVAAMQLGARLGLRPNPKRLQRAAMVDALVGQSQMPRSEALRLVEFLQ